MEFSVKFIKYATIRAIKTAAQVALGMITVGATIHEVDWATVLSVSCVSAVYSLLTSIVGGIPEVKIPDNEDDTDEEEEDDE